MSGPPTVSSCGRVTEVRTQEAEQTTQPAITSRDRRGLEPVLERGAQQQRDDLHRQLRGRRRQRRSRTRSTNRSSAVARPLAHRWNRSAPTTPDLRDRAPRAARARTRAAARRRRVSASWRMIPRHSSPSRPSRSAPTRRARRGRRSSARSTARAGRRAALPCRRSGRRARRSCGSPAVATASADVAWNPLRANRSAAAVSSCARVSARRCSCVRAIPAHYIGSPIYVGPTIFLSGRRARAAGPIPILYATAARSATSFTSCSCCTGATHRRVFRRQLSALHRPPSTKLLATQAIPMIAITLTRLRAPYPCREPVRPGSFDFALELSASHRMFAGSTPRKLVMIVQMPRKAA